MRAQEVTLAATGGTREFAAEVRSRVESRPGFRVGGKLVARSAEVGQHVKVGQVLAQLDAGDLRLGQEAAAASAQAAQTQYELAAAEFRRFEELRKQGFISAWELERRETQLKATRAQADQARAQAELQRNQAGHATLVAPAAGIVTAVEAEPGAVLAAGTPVLRLAHDGPRDAVFAVPEDGVAAMRPLVGRAGVLKVRAWGQAASMPATVREVAAAADAVTRTFAVKADLGAAPVQLGQSLVVSLPLPPRSGVARLPLSAVMQQQGKSAVWLLDRQTMTVIAQPVVVAGAEGNDVVIEQGLRPGHWVVTAGVHALNPGQKVKLYQDPAPPPPGAASAQANR